MLRCICKNEYLYPGNSDALLVYILGEIYTYEKISPKEYSLTGKVRRYDNGEIVRTLTLDEENFNSFMMDISEHRENQLYKLIKELYGK